MPIVSADQISLLTLLITSSTNLDIWSAENLAQNRRFFAYLPRASHIRLSPNTIFLAFLHSIHIASSTVESIPPTHPTFFSIPDFVKKRARYRPGKKSLSVRLPRKKSITRQATLGGVVSLQKDSIQIAHILHLSPKDQQGVTQILHYHNRDAPSKIALFWPGISISSLLYFKSTHSWQRDAILFPSFVGTLVTHQLAQITSRD